MKEVGASLANGRRDLAIFEGISAHGGLEGHRFFIFRRPPFFHNPSSTLCEPSSPINNAANIRLSTTEISRSKRESNPVNNERKSNLYALKFLGERISKTITCPQRKILMKSFSRISLAKGMSDCETIILRPIRSLHCISQGMQTFPIHLIFPAQFSNGPAFVC